MDTMSILAKVKEEMKGAVGKIESLSSNLMISAKGQIDSLISNAKKEISSLLPATEIKLDSIASEAKASLTKLTIAEQNPTNINKIVANTQNTTNEVVASSKQTDTNKTNKKKSTFIYEFLLSRTNSMDKNIPHITDFHYLAFIRDPVMRQSTYIDMQAMIPISTLTVIESEINNGKFPNYELTCYQLKDVDKENINKKNIQKIFFNTFVVIISISKQKDNISSDRPTAEGSIPVRMLLVNPIAYQMSKNTGFNKIFSPTVAPEPENPILIALETIINNNFNPQSKDSKMSSFTDYVIKKYAGTSSNIKQIVLGDKNTVNLTGYKQITVPPTLPEINVPEYIISTYKPFTTPSFWFFDIFNFGNYDNNSKPINGKIPIWCFLINFFNCKNTFKKIDISKDSDIMSFTHLLRTESFVDAKGIINRPNAVVNFIGPNMTQVLHKLGNLPTTLMADNTSEKQDARMTSLKIYYPDGVASAKNRLYDCMSLFTDHIDQIEYYETTNTSPEWLQFGKLYNLERDANTGINTNEYIHTPLCIVNIFNRRQTKDNTLECITKYSMLRLINKKESINVVSTPPQAPAPDPPKGPPPSPVPPPPPPEVKVTKKFTYTKGDVLAAQERIRFQTRKQKSYLDKFMEAKRLGLSPDVEIYNENQHAIRGWILEQRKIIDIYNSETGESVPYM